MAPKTLLFFGILFAIHQNSIGATTEKRDFTFRDVASYRSVGQAVISPDASAIAYTLYLPRIPYKDENGSAWSELHIYDLSSGNSEKYVFGEINVSRLAWMPDSSGITFVTTRNGDEKPSLYFIPLRGGESRKILGFDNLSIGQYSLSPDGKRVAFLAIEKETDDEKKRREAGFPLHAYGEGLKNTRVWLATIDDKESEPEMLELKGSASQLRWSPDGSHLAVALSPTSSTDDLYLYSVVHIVNLDTKKDLRPLGNKGKMGSFRWSSDGSYIALISGEDIYDPQQGRAMVTKRDEGRLVDVLPGLLGHVRRIAWSSDEKLITLVDEGVWSTIKKINVDTGNIKQVWDGSLKQDSPVFSSLSVADDGKSMVLVGDSSLHPSEVYYYKLGKGEPRRLTDSNPWLEEIAFGKQEVIEYRASNDELLLQGILIRPVEDVPGQRYPLILHIHGGPEAHVRNGWLTYYSHAGQLAAARGFMVFYPNYRGSTGRGVEFSKLSQGDAGGKEFDDYIDAIDHLADFDWADSNRVGIMGGSYGGYAAAWGATYFTEYFKASVMFVGISDRTWKWAGSDIPEEMYFSHEKVKLWENREFNLTRSPIHYVPQANTPLLIVHGQKDLRVNPAQSLELYNHMNEIRPRVPLLYLPYDDEGHGNRRAGARLDYNMRTMRWMEHFVRDGNDEVPPFELDYEAAIETDEDKKEEIPFWMLTNSW